MGLGPGQSVQSLSWSESMWCVQEGTRGKKMLPTGDLASLTDERRCACVSGGVLKVTLVLNMRN